ncbi:RSP_7527 family protein [Tritonibacter scottomollicae]|uniref:Uncharacterized protein n=2 Tax=Tritonibacter TaxID=2083206 RepID=A0A2T1AIN6_TRISK|nr:hypothetical protein [Tritonibacter scottomollicae]PRZ48464.1 hypothetical protein CLV89_104292 [Tritonibacter scottomollicae]WOI33668.1 hypothetical protein R1T40_02645 [Tritonibacter scottomollicae]
MDLRSTAPLLSDDLKEIELRARRMRAEAFAAMFSAIGSALVRSIKAPALIFSRPRAA